MHKYMGDYYKEWLLTQKLSFGEYNRSKAKEQSWLMTVPELFSERAPGHTCLEAIANGMGTVDNPPNNSKGCGGIMRIAPLALRYPNVNHAAIDLEGAKVAALTHGHSLGYMPAAMLVHIINSIISNDKEVDLRLIVEDAVKTTQELFEGDDHLEELITIISNALSLSKSKDNDLQNIHRLGEGWTAEETLAIAIYCCLRYPEDFSKAIITSVNHNGDSDSTGAVTGNIMGAIHGYDAIDEKWKAHIELKDVLTDMAAAIFCNNRGRTESNTDDSYWKEKYTSGYREMYSTKAYEYLAKRNEIEARKCFYQAMKVTKDRDKLVELGSVCGKYALEHEGASHMYRESRLIIEKYKSLYRGNALNSIYNSLKKFGD